MGYIKYVDFKDLDKTKQIQFIEEVKRIFKRNDINSGNFTVSHVLLGNASEPYTKICLADGLELYDETNSPDWSKEENTKAIIRRRYHET